MQSTGFYTPLSTGNASLGKVVMMTEDRFSCLTQLPVEIMRCQLRSIKNQRN
jgi:hypothetical protein